MVNLNPKICSGLVYSITKPFSTLINQTLSRLKAFSQSV